MMLSDYRLMIAATPAIFPVFVVGEVPTYWEQYGIKEGDECIPVNDGYSLYFPHLKMARQHMTKSFNESYLQFKEYRLYTSKNITSPNTQSLGTFKLPNNYHA